MTLQKDTFARDAVEINGQFIEDLIPNSRFSTLTAVGREINTYNPDTGEYDKKVITIKYVLSCTDESMFRTYSTYLQHILNRVDADIVFNDEYDKFLIGDIHDKGFTEKHGVWALGEYEIICKTPFKYAKEIKSKTMTLVQGHTDIQNTSNFRYAGTIPTNPVIKIQMNTISDNYGLINAAASNSFFNLTNNKTNKYCYIGNSANSDYNASSIFNIDMTSTKASRSSFTSNGWDAVSGFFAVNSVTDDNYNKGQGLTYKALVPTTFVTSDENWRNMGCNISKDFGTNLANFIFSYNIRMFADNPTKCGVIALTLLSSSSTRTGIYFVKNSMSSINGVAYYVIDDKVVGSDTIDFSKYNTICGLSGKYEAYSTSLTESGRRYFADDIVNTQRNINSLIEPKVVNGFVFTEPDTNVSISKFNDVYTFKIGKEITRTYSYKKETGSELYYSSTTIGFKDNVFNGSSYAADYTMTMQLTGISLIKYENATLLNNNNLLSGGDTFIVNTKDNSVYKTRLAEKGLYCPEILQQDSHIGDFTIDHQSQIITAEYFATDADAVPTIEVKYNEVYV